MTDKKNESGNLDLDKTLADTTHKVEDFYHNNKKQINYALIAVVAIIALYTGYKQLYLKPLEEEAQREIFRAQQYFDKDSFALALNGNEQFKGFEAIADEYGASKAGNLAHYYAGVCNLRTGKFAEAIDHLESFETSNEVVGVLAQGALGDAYVENGELEKGVSHYMKASRLSANKLTTPLFLKKAGIVYEALNKYSDAEDVYETIKKDYPESPESSDIDKYLARVQTLQASN